MQYKTILDVRTPEEFRGGHVAGSINIPLQEVTSRLSEIQKLPQPILLCCASGARSASATTFLKGNKVSCENGGGWMEVNQIVNAQTFQPS